MNAWSKEFKIQVYSYKFMYVIYISYDTNIYRKRWNLNKDLMAWIFIIFTSFLHIFLNNLCNHFRAHCSVKQKGILDKDELYRCICILNFIHLSHLYSKYQKPNKRIWQNRNVWKLVSKKETQFSLIAL